MAGAGLPLMFADVETPSSFPDYVEDELDHYEEQIRKYRAGEVGETKMQKLRLHFGSNLNLSLKSLALDALLQEDFNVRRHVVECSCEFAELIMRARVHAMREIAALDKLHTLIEFMNSACDRSRHPCGGEERK